MSGFRSERGAVSLFAVIFAMLLISVVTISFLRLMLSDQNQATGNDLAQSAYDSAQAGVEDAKRALLSYQGDCSNGGSCNWPATWDGTCNQMIRDRGVVTAGVTADEIKVQQSTSTYDQALDQAYTCVTVSKVSPDYIGSLTPDQSVLVPLLGAGTFDRVRLQWFSPEDVSASGAVTLRSMTSGSQPLLTQANWADDTPSLMRAQYIQVPQNFALSSFDYATGTQSNTNTLFLYPTGGTSAPTSVDILARDSRPNSAGVSSAATASFTPQPVRCAASVSAGGYSCSVVIDFPEPIGGTTAAASYLWLTALYNATHYRVSLTNGGAAVNFDGAQPIVDSTGRANTVFRRIQSRVDLQGTFPYPQAAVDVNDDFCKNFGITDQATGYVNNDTSCTP